MLVHWQGLALSPQPHFRVATGGLENHLLHGVFGRDGTATDFLSSVVERERRGLEPSGQASYPIVRVVIPLLPCFVCVPFGVVVLFQVTMPPKMVGLQKGVFLHAPATELIAEACDNRVLAGPRANYVGEKACHCLVFLQPVDELAVGTQQVADVPESLEHWPLKIPGRRTFRGRLIDRHSPFPGTESRNHTHTAKHADTRVAVSATVKPDEP